MSVTQEKFVEYTDTIKYIPHAELAKTVGYGLIKVAGGIGYIAYSGFSIHPFDNSHEVHAFLISEGESKGMVLLKGKLRRVGGVREYG